MKNADKMARWGKKAERVTKMAVIFYHFTFFFIFPLNILVVKLKTATFATSNAKTPRSLTAGDRAFSTLPRLESGQFN